MNKKMKKPAITIGETGTNSIKSFLKGLNFTSEQVTGAVKYVNRIYKSNINAKTKAAKDRVLKKDLKKTLDTIPMVVIKACGCPHNCGNNIVSGTTITICNNVFNTIKTTYPEIVTTGVSLVNIWTLLLKNSYSVNHMPFQLTSFLRALTATQRDAFLKFFNQKGYTAY